LVTVTEPVMVSPSLMLSTSRLVTSLECDTIPELTAVVEAVVEVKLAPEPTATAPATVRVARGTRILRRLAAISCSWEVVEPLGAALG
jgi:hypothetical protein